MGFIQQRICDELELATTTVTPREAVQLITYRRLGTNGGLGNQLWQIGATIGIAASRGESVGFPYWSYRAHFSVPDRYFPDLTGLRTEDLGIDYLQDLALFEGVADQIRAYFAPPRSLRDRLARRHSALLAQRDCTAIHVRRGDYLRHPEQFRVLQMPYYEEAMSQFGPPYLVFSADPDWCRAHFPAECRFLVGNLNYEDLHLMSTCARFIISNSTFAWWPAWLSGRPTIAPRRWWGPAWAGLESKMLPDEWTLLNVSPSLRGRRARISPD